MSDLNIPDGVGPAYGVELVGPFVAEWKVTCNGYRVPNLSAIPFEAEDGTDMVNLCLDERFLIEATKYEAQKWIPFIANCMAVAAGYSAFGENSRHNPNPFQVKMTGL